MTADDGDGRDREDRAGDGRDGEHGAEEDEAERDRRDRAAVRRDGVGIGLVTGAYGLSFGALGVAAGLSPLQTSALSLLMFTGASQFALVGVIAAGGLPVAGLATAFLLGVRNGLYGLHLGPLLGRRGWRRAVAAHLVIDESAAMALGRRTPELGRLGFYAAGVSVFVCWNLATVIGALGAQALSRPEVLGLDVVAPAAFAALLAPRMRTREAWLVAGAAVVLALGSAPFVPAGVPVLLATLPALAWALRPVPPGARAGTVPGDRS